MRNHSSLQTERGGLKLFEMVKVVPEDTKLPYVLWLHSSGSKKSKSHLQPELVVETDEGMIPVSISSHPLILIDKQIEGIEGVKEFIIKHMKDLVRHWDDEMSDREILNILIED